MLLHAFAWLCLLWPGHGQPAKLPDATLVYCSEANPQGFDDAQYATSYDATVAFTLYDRLVELNLDGSGVSPGLAESWEISADGREYTFHLRHGVKFQTVKFKRMPGMARDNAPAIEVFKPTREFNADDVVFTFERMLNPEHPFRKAYPTTFPYFQGLGLAKNITRIEAIDPYTVRFMLANIDAPFLHKVAMAFASILSLEYANILLDKQRASDINRFPVGTGPFIFSEYTKDASIYLDGNPDYWRPGIVKVDKLVFDITVDAAVRLQKMRTGDCQVMSYPRPADIAAIRADPKLQLPSVVGFNLAFLAYNTAKQPFDSLLVRRALDMAIDKRAILNAVYQGEAQVATNPMPPAQWSYDKSIKDAPYDPVLAKALLAEAGHPDGLTLDLLAMTNQRPYNPNAALMAQLIQQDWAKIGVRVNVVTYEVGEFLQRARRGAFDTLLVGWTGDFADPDDWLGMLLGCDALKSSNFSKWCYKPFDDLITQARATIDTNSRATLYQRAQQIFKEQVPFTPIAHATVYQPLARDVRGFRIDPFGPTLFLGVSRK
ncbi:ABC transporter substrate-binding protein [Paraburkholderia sp. Tr-20389]|uniref:ABC transporter substrate-binding protein n=1 Tax=Paraburkholderia sp. Tr-20389 TaxID=2703903 RepID=UPI001F11D4EC|nr:ABC transporter substrate-binding protein [Paraburkholderia sp. Tr-20389]